MFDSRQGDDATSAAPGDWSVPGRPAPEPGPVEPDPCAVALSGAVEALLGQDLASLAGPVALERCRTVLAQTERLGVVVAEALADVQDRELFADGDAGSLPGWLRQQPCGDAGRASRSRRLAARPQVRAAIVDGDLGLTTADVLAKALQDLPRTTEPGQVEGVLTGAVPELLSTWSARNALNPSGHPAADARAAAVQQAIDGGVAAVTASPAERLEAAYVLIGQAVAPGALATQLQLIADALVPEQLLDREQACHDGRSLVLTKKRLQPGWRLRGELTDEVGAALHTQLQVRSLARARRDAALRKTARDRTGDPELFGSVGPGPLSDPQTDDSGSEPVPRIQADQLTHDLLGELLEDPTGTREHDAPGPTPSPTPFTIITGIDTLEGRVGALPGTLLLPTGPVPLSPEALRRLGCHSRLNAVLLDAARTPIGASGNHRSATDKERRAMHALWGLHCAVLGCACTDTVPHHADPWWRTGRTTLADLIPLCRGDHHDVHDGHRTLLLRDGRRIDDNGWVRDF
jgi:hypothetical protein